MEPCLDILGRKCGRKPRHDVGCLKTMKAKSYRKNVYREEVIGSWRKIHKEEGRYTFSG
jgi:hypothetical protein